MKRQSRFFYTRWLPLMLVVLTGFWMSCENDLKEVDRITRTDEMPQESMLGVTLVYTDSGYTKAIMESPLIEKYYGEKEKMIFPEGLKVIFFNNDRLQESQLTARYGIFDQSRKMLTVRNNVVFINFINSDTLYTELLNWYQDSARVYTDKTVTIKTVKGVFKGKGLVAGETFTFYDFIDFEGEYYYDDNEFLKK